MTQKETERKIGHAVLLPLPVEADDTEWDLLASNDMPDRDIEIGYVLKRDSWGSGYATEACGRLLEFAFSETQLSVIVATADPENVASQRVLEKCGLRGQGLVRAFGQYVPGFRITRHDWLRHKAHRKSE